MVALPSKSAAFPSKTWFGASFSHPAVKPLAAMPGPVLRDFFAGLIPSFRGTDASASLLGLHRRVMDVLRPIPGVVCAIPLDEVFLSQLAFGCSFVVRPAEKNFLLEGALKMSASLEEHRYLLASSLAGLSRKCFTPRDRERVRTWLPVLGTADQAGQAQRLSPEVLEFCRLRQDGMRLSAVLGEVSAVLSALQSCGPTNAFLRADAAAMAAGFPGDARVESALMTALDDPYLYTRVYAARSLGFLKSARAFEPLLDLFLDLMTSGKAPDETLSVVAEALSLIDAQKTKEALHDFFWVRVVS